ncbi:M56 family metallopeptidase [Stieleria sp. TO1_6]|uniref:M56 family metallopeptidase n=1 Tax=Stieleria tagensis TaxID=2956795 RepID=UPI00209A8E94|nr:M56 family metallopeptidase [Stieleria tagensis]MCO8123295.1 M56 family metallopeptidase [Stieleria tagensis]
MNVVSWIESVWQIGMLYAMQSTILILGVMAVVRLCRIRDAAVLSMIYRFTMVAVVVSPMVTVGMKQANVDGWWPAKPSQKASAEAEVSFSTPAIPMPNDFATTGGDPYQGIDNDTMFNEPVVVAAVDSLPVFDVPPSELARAEAAGDEMTLTTSDATATADARAVFVCKTIAVTAWLVVSLALLIRHGRAFLSLRRSLKRSVPASSEIQAVCDQMARDLQVKSPRVVCSPYFESPFLSGVWIPVIHLCSDDDGVMEASDNGEVRDVLAHELAHLKRHDLIVRMMNHAVLSLLFFQPLLWRLVDWIEGTAEDVCDDFALGLGASRQCYARRLVDLAERCDFPPGSAVGIASGNSMLQHRVKRIMEDGRRLSLRVSLHAAIVSGLTTSIVVLVIGLLLTPPSSLSAQPPASSPAEAPNVETTNDDLPDVRPFIEQAWPRDPVRGTILSDSRPIAKAKVYWWRSRSFEVEPMSPVRVTTDAKGQFEITRTPPNPNDPAIWDMREAMLVRAKGYAFEYTWPRQFGASIPFDPDWPGKNPEAIGPGAPLKLAPEGTAVSGRLIDIEGQPIEGASVRIRGFHKRSFRMKAGPQYLVHNKSEPETEEDRIRDVSSVVHSDNGLPLSDALPRTVSDSNGRFRLTELPSDCYFRLLVEREGIESSDLVVRNYGDEEVVSVPQAENFKSSAPTQVYPADFEAVIGPSTPVLGTVTDTDTGKPIAGAFVQTTLVNTQRITTTGGREHWTATTDAAGNYRIDGLPAGDGNKVVVFGPNSDPYLPVAGETDGSNRVETTETVHELNFQLKKGVWAEGRVYDAETDEPFYGSLTYYWFRNRDLEAEYKGVFRAYFDGRYFTDYDGRFRIPVLPTPGIIAFSTGNRDQQRMSAYSSGYGEWELAKYRKPDAGFPYYVTAPTIVMPDNYNRLGLVDPKPKHLVVHVDLPISKAKPIPITILNPDGKPATTELEVYGANERYGWQDKMPQGLIVEDLLDDRRRKVFAFDRSRGLVGGTIVEHGAGKQFTIKLSEAGRAHGRLVDADGESVSDASIWANFGDSEDAEEFAVWARVDGKRINPSVLIPDEDGRFEILGLSPEWRYSARVSKGNRSIGHAFRSLVIQPGENRDLGDIVIDVSQD